MTKYKPLRMRDLTPEQRDWYIKGAAKEIAKSMLGTDRFETASLLLILRQAIPIARAMIKEQNQ
jgi:hypothetical protein